MPQFADTARSYLSVHISTYKHRALTSGLDDPYLWSEWPAFRSQHCLLTLAAPISLSISVFMCPTATCVPADTIFWRSNCYADNVPMCVNTMLWISYCSHSIQLLHCIVEIAICAKTKQTFMFLHFCFQSKIANNRSIYKFILYTLIASVVWV